MIKIMLIVIGDDDFDDDAGRTLTVMTSTRTMRMIVTKVST